MMNVNLYKELNTTLGAIPKLAERTEFLCTEDAGSFVNGISNYVTEKIKDISTSFSINASRLDKVDKKDLSEQAKELMDLKKDIAAIIKDVKFQNVDKRETPVTLGLKIDLLSLVNKIDPVIKTMSTDIIGTIDEVDTIVSNMLANADYRKRLKPGKKFSELYTTIGKMDSLMEDAIDPNGTIDRLSIGKVLPNLNSLNTIYDRLKEQNNLFTYKDIKTIKNGVSVLNEKVDSLYQLFSEDEDSLKVSKESITELAYALEALAEYVTKSITVFYLLNQANSIAVNAVKIIKM
jgi:hypothetical protein